MSNRNAKVKEADEKTVSVEAHIPHTSLKRRVNEIRLYLLLLFFAVVCVASINAADTLRWETNKVSADIKSTDLTAVLEKIAAVTGWHVFVEPETLHTVSAKFNNLPPGEALHKLLGDVNFFLLPDAKQPKLYVFRTRMQNATRMVHPAPIAPKETTKIIPNELIVRLKPGAKIEDLAKLLGAKVIGRIDGINAYRLKFDDQSAADAGRDQLSSNSDVASVENNYSIDRPTIPSQLGSTTVPPPQLQLKDPPATGRIIVGLVDTGVQQLGNGLDSFLLKAQSVVDGQPDPNSPSHGTAMAETILRSLESNTKGSTSVQILPVDVYGANETTSTFDVLNGIVLAYNGGAQVINLSLGSEGDSQSLRDLIKQLSDKNIVFFAAKGNQPVTTPFYPAADPNVYPVTALDPNGQLASYANRADIPSIPAPGTSIIYYNGKAYYVTGTSPATAYVSGGFAGYMDANHKTTAEALPVIQSRLTTTPGK
jgi:Subtilase family